MPVAAKTPFSSKNPATLAKSFGALQPIAGTASVQAGEVICPLPNGDGSQCRKKCVGNFAYRSICEHIRRAHPDNWIPKLPASPETFAKMVGLIPCGSQSTGPNSVRKHLPPVRKPSKLSKHLGDQYMDGGLSPPSTASESEILPPLSIVANSAAIFQSRFPPTYPGPHEYDHDEYEDEEEMECERSIEEEDIDVHTETETEDEAEYTRLHHHHHHHHGQYPPRRHARSRKRHSTLDSTGSSSFGSSRWDELIEAATTRAVVENSPGPLSPPPTANAVPTMCPNTPSNSTISVTSTVPDIQQHQQNQSQQAFYSPRVQCAACRALVPIKNSYVCTDCVAGFCEDCALAAGKRGRCGECRVFGGKFKPLKVNIRA